WLSISTAIVFLLLQGCRCLLCHIWSQIGATRHHHIVFTETNVVSHAFLCMISCLNWDRHAVTCHINGLSKSGMRTFMHSSPDLRITIHNKSNG
ncbi:hypothetical protein BCR44DRAFT_345158, partial [Catenaria anguillulae PL171]